MEYPPNHNEFLLISNVGLQAVSGEMMLCTLTSLEYASRQTGLLNQIQFPGFVDKLNRILDIKLSHQV